MTQKFIRSSVGITAVFDDEADYTIPASKSQSNSPVLHSVSASQSNAPKVNTNANSLVKRESTLIKGAGIIAFKIVNRGCSFTFTSKVVSEAMRKQFNTNNIYGNVQAFKQKQKNSVGADKKRYPEEIKRINSIRYDMDKIIAKYALESITVEGFSICSVQNFNKAKAEIMLEFEKLDKAVEVFINKLPDLIEADKKELGPAFDINVYKTPDEYRNIYRCEIKHMIISNEQFTPDENVSIIKETQFAKYILVNNLMKEAVKALTDYKDGTKEKFTVNTLANIIDAIDNNCSQQIIEDKEFTEYCGELKKMITMMKNGVDNLRGKNNVNNLVDAIDVIQEEQMKLVNLMESFV